MQTIVAETEPIDLLTLAGVGEEVWAKVDTDAYLDNAGKV